MLVYNLFYLLEGGVSIDEIVAVILIVSMIVLPVIGIKIKGG